MASISVVKICNMALSHIGAKSNIESLTESSAEASVCNLWYDWTRRQMLELHEWKFAKKRVAVPLLETEPNSQWLYRYEYPSDCVKARLIENPTGPNEDVIPFSIENTSDGLSLSVLTSQEEAVLIYTFDLTNVALFSSIFVDALSWRLAAEIAFRLTGDRGVATSALRQFNQTFQIAMSSNAAEGFDAAPRDSELIRVRA